MKYVISKPLFINQQLKKQSILFKIILTSSIDWYFLLKIFKFLTYNYFLFLINTLNIKIPTTKYDLNMSNHKPFLSHKFLTKKQTFNQNNLFKILFPFSLFTYNLLIKKKETFRYYFSWSLNINKQRIFFINIPKFIKKWVNTYLFLINLFYYQLFFLTFGSIHFKHETLALNWYLLKWNIQLWKYASSFFFLKQNKVTYSSSSFFSYLEKKNFSILLVTDYYYHFKTLHLIKKNNFFIVGLLDFHINPFKFNYGIFVPKINFFFIKLFYAFILQTQKFSYYLRFLLQYSIWNFFFRKWLLLN